MLVSPHDRDPNQVDRDKLADIALVLQDADPDDKAEMAWVCPRPSAPTLTVTNPLTGARTPLVGVIETLEWEGRAGDPLEINMYVSQENATQLKRLQQSTLTTTKVSALDYSILDYDPETKQWFTAGINLNVFKVSVQIAPGQNRAYALTFANSATTQVTKPGGLVIGTSVCSWPPRPAGASGSIATFSTGRPVKRVGQSD